MEETHTKKQKFNLNLSTQNSILLGSLLIAISIGASMFFGFKTLGEQNKIAIKDLHSNEGQVQQQQEPTYNLEAMNPVTKDDHIKGNPNAKVKIVEYSDTECPFCKKLHFTMNDLMKEYGDKGDVAWVYRHMPIAGLHQKAQKEAEATECAEEQGGNIAFWKYLDRMMEITPANDGLDVAELPNIAKFVGLDVAKFNQCLSSGKMAAKVNAQAKNGAETGGQGTPWSIVAGENIKLPLSGAQPIEAIKQLIDVALKGK